MNNKEMINIKEYIQKDIEFSLELLKALQDYQKPRIIPTRPGLPKIRVGKYKRLKTK